MSNNEQDTSTGTKIKKTTALLGVAAVGVAGGVAIESHSEDNPSASKAAVAEKQITTDIALKHSENILQGGTAVVDMANGDRINITNPILSDSGAVAERTRGEDNGEGSLVTAYAEGENGVEDVAYFGGNGSALDPDGFSTPEQALAQTTPVQVERVDGALSGAGQPDVQDGANNLIASPGPNGQDQVQNPQEHIAEGTVYTPEG